jgi:hypothetical protein
MVDAALAYIESLYGCPYGYWTGMHIERSNATPFYAGLPNDPLPTHDTLVRQGIACTGLLNLLCRHAGFVVPGVLDPKEEHPGGTLAWGRALPWISITPVTLPPAIPPPGTLFFRHYRSFEDQGHVAIVARDSNTLIQSYPVPWDPVARVLSPPGVTFTELPIVVPVDDPPDVACYYDGFCLPITYTTHLQRLR